MRHTANATTTVATSSRTRNHGNERSAEMIERVGEHDHEDRRRQREAEPREERAQRARAQQPDRDADLAARWTGQRLAERHDLGVRRFVEPAPAHHVLAAEVAEVCDGSTEGCEPEPQRDAEDLERR